jgi:RHS repeat-associated protein
MARRMFFISFHLMGNRIAKHIFTDNAFTLLEKSTYYVRDASGNVMAVYDRIIDASEETSEFMLSERHIYGSSRIGMDVSTHVFGPDPYTSLTETTRELGHKQYEISNHLGNVLSVITDQKLPVVDATVVVSYSAVVVTATDYSPFGVGLYGRSWSGGYRYGFQGQEEDGELWSGSVSYKYRIEDARLGRFFSVDPLHCKYPFNSSFAFSENRTISARELEGLEAWNTTSEWDECYINAYRESVKSTIQVAQASNLRFTCEDLAIFVLIKFASQNGLPVVIQNGTGIYHNEDPSFSTTEELMNKIQITTGARDLMKSTIPIDPCSLDAGDLILLDLEGVGVANHTQVVTSQSEEKTTINQGNFVSNWEIFSELRFSEDPKSENYLGTFVQIGQYDNYSGDYTRDGETTSGLLLKSSTYPRSWDFDGFNELDSFLDYFNSRRNSANTTVAPVAPVEPNTKQSCHGN